MQHVKPTLEPSWLRTGTGQKSRKSNTVYESLKARIVIGELTEDSPITEQALARQFGCSQSTVREALLRLQEDGLVLRHSYRGTTVTAATDEEAIIMLRLRLNIELTALDAIIRNITPEKLAELRQIADLYDQLRADRDTYGVSEADIAFHMTLHQVADMPVVEPILQRAMLHLHRYLLIRHKDKMVWIGKIEASHSALLDAIEAKDRDRAADLTYQHTTSSTIEVDPSVRRTIVGDLEV
ncbi:putative GntR family transcriptional regulator [Roseibium sp. TrichSKD4]|uniref:GntR family transcriptional regulator n=1 Tax=Roseibium sp. TrichSKD4 TaxID=744980 RepID=UPI0001E577DA|nr:GntR family transcriptional regulator [Roseibium sp. TrichSKD4]EFO28911.1 putative GntR family transcriptional regulator [Roseibium sp. TrichSKD4]